MIGGKRVPGGRLPAKAALGPAPRRRSRKARALGLLVLVALGYLAGVGVAAAFGLGDPWTRGILGAGLALGTAAVEALRRRTPSG